MNEQSTFGYQEGDQPAKKCGPPSMNPAQYKFSPDELKVLQECNSESFYKRSLPLGTAMGLGTVYAVKNGHMKPNPRFGAFPKVTLAVMMGYFIGKISYQNACAEKLMALPGSYIGQLLRDRRDGKTGDLGPKSSTSMFGATQGDIYSDAGQGSSLDLDTHRPIFSEDPYSANSSEGGGTQEPNAASPKTSLSYDELRTRNRGEYSGTRQDPYRMDPSAMPPVRRTPPQPAQTTPTNKYGDSME